MGFDLSRSTSSRDLPRALREVSGLTVTPAGKLLAHDDEQAVLREVDPTSGKVVRSFSFVQGGRPIPGDFEGIVAAGGLVYLTTSDGLLLEGAEGADGAAVEPRITRTGLGDVCEIEGLAHDPTDGSLLFACKKANRRELRPFVTLLRWSLSRRALSGAPVRIPIERVASPIGEDDFRPSDLWRDAASGHLLILSSHQGAVAEVTPDGAVVSVRRLARGHPQAEGLAMLPDGTLAVADEGGRGDARLTLYRKTPVR